MSFYKMPKFILFLDPIRQEEIDTFYNVSQMHREYYKGYPKSYHPLSYFRDAEYVGQCPPEMSYVYLGFPPYHVKYKTPSLLPSCTGRTSNIPSAPDRILTGRFNKAPCKAYQR